MWFYFTTVDAHSPGSSITRGCLKEVRQMLAWPLCHTRTADHFMMHRQECLANNCSADIVISFSPAHQRFLSVPLKYIAEVCIYTFSGPDGSVSASLSTFHFFVSAMAVVTIDNTLGAVFIGGWVTAISFGITCVQAIFFLRHEANKNKTKLKWAVSISLS